jgi:hypothetical protein
MALAEKSVTLQYRGIPSNRIFITGAVKKAEFGCPKM